MPRDYDDSDDRSPDIEDLLTRLVQKADQPSGAQLPGPDWPPPSEDEPTNIGTRLVKLVSAIVLVFIAALAIKLRTGNGGDPLPPHEPEAQRQGVMSRPAARRDTSAVCKDSTVSFSKHSSGTCAGHGGVARWVHRPRS